eukprot:CAMPEP_0196193854 /NCGR_PEP_ID=MMETSP0911-20130528/49757_1 /TAXON_ID=49265 /ORGANISM="Thalassiosira rotula, Strain GSO102" /LENGTH=40 /DNA_ID= /DNA_START= /DNA_END= /DNA_ORIENTATION=
MAIDTAKKCTNCHKSIPRRQPQEDSASDISAEQRDLALSM